MRNNEPTRGLVTVVGTLNIDHVWRVPVLPRRGQTILADATERQFGGKGANQAVAAARQGACVRLVGAVADDPDGRGYREHLAREGVDVAQVVQVSNHSTGSAHVYVEPRGENLIVVDRGANACAPLAALRPALAESDVVLVQLECELAFAMEALRLAEEAGVRAVLNASPVHPAFAWGRHAIDTVIVNEHECAECFGVSPAELWTWAEPRTRELLERCRVQHIVITQGAEPTFHLSKEVKQAVPTHPVVPRDTVGAGDTFAGVLATELARGQEWGAAISRANVAAALSTLAVGAQAAMPTREEIDKAISNGVAPTTSAI